MTSKSFLSFKLHHLEKVAKIKLNVVCPLRQFPNFSTRNVFGLRIEEFLQTRYQFILIKSTGCLGGIRLRKISFRFYCDKEIGLNKILRHILLEFGVSSFWDSSAWKRNYPRTPPESNPGYRATFKSIFSHVHTQ
jgi:hypothetical protein